VLQSDQKLRHLPFFEEVAGLEADSAEERAATAGLVTLRLVDAWLDGALWFKEDDWSVPNVHKAIRAMDKGTTMRGMLLRIVDVVRARKPDIHAVVTTLMAYAQALEYDAKWLLAGDVYQTLLAHLHPIEDSEASIAAHLRLATCYRSLMQVEHAVEAFASAARIGHAAGDMVGVLRARIGEAQIAWLRGNLPHAETLLDETIAQTKGNEDLRAVRSRALQDRSAVAILSGQYELGIRLAYDALAHPASSMERDRILNNIASAFTHLGVYSAARDAYLVLSATSQEQYMRWTATLNLIDVSSLTGAEVLFEQLRREMLVQDLPPQLATEFELIQGSGFLRFGKGELARDHLNRAAALAAEFGLNQILFEAEAAMSSLNAPTPPHRVSAEMPLEVEEVASAIRELRHSVAEPGKA